ncbi:MAG: sodium:proton exchanger [Chloroflexota bacterium]|jgi:NhaP-type Na+/H+ or K+/H+ antiporter|nr:sodium:proton exchanger [Chloroflexota bacterium]
MLTVGLFCAGLLAYALFSGLLERRSVTAQIMMLALGVGLGLAVRGTSEAIVETELLHIAGELALILALVVDAARIDMGALRRTAGLPIRLLVIGLPLTIALGTIVAVVVLPGITVLEAIIVATLLAPTDAALGAMVVNSRFVPRRIRQALNVESGLNDGLVTPIVLVAAAVAVAGGDLRDTAWIADAVSQIAFGAVAGVLVGVVGALALRLAVARQWMHEGTHWMVAPAVGFLAWFVAHELGGNVFVAAFAAGLAMTAAYGRVPESFLVFAEVGGELLGLMVFFLFGALLVGIAGTISVSVVLYAVLSLTVIRMIPVAIALRGTRLRSPTVAFIGWFGPRGLASIVLTFVALGDGGGNPPFSATIVAAVAVTIALSVIAHGMSAGPAAERYGAFVATLPEDAAEHEHTTELPTRRGVHRRSVTSEPSPPA